MESWSKHEVYDEVEDIGQDCISVRWVVTPKIIDGKHSVKTRLCARGFEESAEFRTDSPTCMRESVRITLCIIATQGWTLHSIDFKTAFLQGNTIGREVYLRPPEECNTNKIWRLKKTVYGLADAPRVWFLRLKEQLLKLGVSMSTYDPGLFYWHSSKGLEGVLVCFVDDLLWGGSHTFENQIIMKLRSNFEISKENSVIFKYIGIDLKQNSDYSVVINQSSYLGSINLIPMSKERQLQKKEALTKVEKRQLRGAVGQLNWVSGISRPDIIFNVSEAASSQKQATVESIFKINKVIKYVKNDDSNILVPRFSNIKDFKLCVYTDASYDNLPYGGSQGGHIIFLSDSYNNSCPIAWRSTKIKRVVKSTLAAETLAFVDGAEQAFLMSNLIAEIIYNKKKLHLTIECRTDNKSLFQAYRTLKTLSDSRLNVEMAIVRQMLEREEIELVWINAKEQLADALTKKGASSLTLLKALQEGMLIS